MADVFISYAKTSKAFVARLAQALEADGYDVWWDAELPPHRAYADVITEEIGKAKAVVVAWSDAAATSQWVRAEADMARQQSKLVQTSIEKGFIPPIPFNQIQVAELAGWNGDAANGEWAKVRIAVSDLVRKGPPGPPPRVKTRGPNLLPLIALGLLIIAGAAAFFWSRGGEAEHETAEAPAITEPAHTPTTGGATGAAASSAPTAWPALMQAKLATALILNRGMDPACNGAMIDLRHVVTVAECDVESGGTYFQRTDGSTYPLVMSGRQARGAIAVYEFVAEAPGARPPPLGERTSDRVRPGAFVGERVAYVLAEPCSLQAPQDGVSANDCISPGGLPGAPVYNDEGRVVGLMRGDGKVLRIERVRADLLALGVAP
ncbi:MAG: TIR domain-containing protein [Hyphomonadaceae bacterium]|nr:TIR domain-containing protein [Hyphomonadaceae bacterium]